MSISAISTPAMSLARTDRAVGLWLFLIAAMIGLMVVVGGLTRLTGSGLSITEWQPVTGVIPPLNDNAWQSEFAKYRGTPQYDLLNRGIGLAGFKAIYWWEWTHRLLGRLLGAVFLIPFLVFLRQGRIERTIAARLGIIFFLGRDKDHRPCRSGSQDFLLGFPTIQSRHMNVEKQAARIIVGYVIKKTLRRIKSYHFKLIGL